MCGRNCVARTSVYVSKKGSRKAALRINKKEYMFVSENINPIAIGKEIKIVRKEKNLKQKDLAKILKISPSTYSVYENGKILINTSFIYKFAKKFNCSIDNIIKKN